MIIELESAEKLNEMFELVKKFSNVEKSVRKTFTMFNVSPIRWDLKKIAASDEMWTGQNLGENSGRMSIVMHFCDAETKTHTLMYEMDIIYYDGVASLKGSNSGKWSYKPPQFADSELRYNTTEKGVRNVLRNGFQRC